MYKSASVLLTKVAISNRNENKKKKRIKALFFFLSKTRKHSSKQLGR
jgi:hypothetical protein